MLYHKAQAHQCQGYMATTQHDLSTQDINSNKFDTYLANNKVPKGHHSKAKSPQPTQHPLHDLCR